jgi:DNA-binding SARP family transcriptional activator
MSESAHLLPQLDRLLERIEALETPLIQVWGWPGSGQEALLRELLARRGDGAAGLALGDFAQEAAWREAMERAGQADWLVASGEPAGRLAEVARWLKPGQRLVFAGTRRLASLLSTSVVAPQELLLNHAEVAALWYLATGDQPTAAATGALLLASDGWLRPLRLTLRATGGAGLETATAEQLLEIQEVRYFLRQDVLGSFTEEELDLLLAAPEDRPGDDEPAERRAGWRILEARGLWLEGAERDRMPRLLAACLARERQRRRRRLGVLAGVAVSLRRGPMEAAGLETGSKVARDEEAAARPSYHLRLLGDADAREVSRGTERDLGWKLRRSFQILAYLASSPELQAGREELSEAIWPVEGERTIDRNFHPTLSHLRRTLEGERKRKVPGPLLFRGGVYRLNPEIDWQIDVREFDRRIEEGRGLAARGERRAAAAAWREAWRLYHGPFLQGHYEAWVSGRREKYQRLYVELLRDLGDVYLQLERCEEALDAYRSVLLEDPLQERIHVAVMRLYAGQGRRDLVRRQYDRLCTLLLEELGVEPLPKTAQEYHRLMT